MEMVIGANAGAPVGSMIAARAPMGVMAVIIAACGDRSIRSAPLSMSGATVIPGVGLSQSGGAERDDDEGSGDGA